VNRQFEAAWRLHAFLTARGIPYAIIGGLAVQRWGQPRFTRDVDLTVLLPPGSEASALNEIASEFPPRIADGVAFALEHRVLPVMVRGAAEADLSLGLPGYEEQVVARSPRPRRALRQDRPARGGETALGDRDHDVPQDRHAAGAHRVEADRRKLSGDWSSRSGPIDFATALDRKWRRVTSRP
jgi:hypothetical protein